MPLLLALTLLLVSPGTDPPLVLVGITVLIYIVMRILYPRPARGRGLLRV